LIICLLIPLGAASASDINTTTADDQVLSATPQVDTLSASVNPEQENDTLSVQENEILSAGLDSGSNNLLGDDGENTVGSFSDLLKLIKISGNTVNLAQDYEFKSTDSTITLDFSITIQGNGHTINGETNKMFTVNGNNIIFNNINFKGNNVDWNGDNGLVKNCTFTNCYSTFSVYGDNFNLKDTKIIHSKIQQLFYFYGVNNLVENAYFLNNTGMSLVFSVISNNNTLKNSTVINCSKGNFPNDGVIYCQRSELNVISCKFINCTDGSSDNNAIIYRPTILNCTDCYFDSPKAYTAVCALIMYVNNCTFKGKYSSGAIRTFSNPDSTLVVVNNSRFENNAKSISIDRATGNSIVNSNFTNCNNPITLNTNSLFTLIDNCRFVNCTSTTSNAPIVISSSKNTVSNCYFSNTMGKYAGAIYVKDGTSNNVDNKTNTYNTQVSLPDVYGTFNNFTSYHTLWVDNETNGIGIENNPCNLTYALMNVENGGFIYLKKGIYYLTGQMVLSATIIGTQDACVIEDGSFYLKQSDCEIRNIIFNNTKSTLRLAPKSSLDNCTFTNFNTGTNILININNMEGFGTTVSNIIFENGTVKNSLCILDECSEYYNITANNIKCTNFFYTEECGNQLYVDNVSVRNSTFDSFKNDGSSQREKAVYRLINVTNCTINDIFIKQSITANYENITFVNNTYKSNSIFIMHRNNEFSNLIVKNYQGNYIFSGGYDLIVSDSYFEDVNLTNIFNNNYIVNVDNITFNKSKMNTFLKYYNSGNVYNELTFDGVNFTSGVIATFGDNVVLNKCNFNNFTGHVVVDGDNVQILDSNFTRGNNSDLNGSSIYLNTGSDMFKAINCRFTSNNASNGTIYVSSDCKRPIFNNCNFTDNTAKYNGGALYIVSTPTDRIVAGINPTTNKTILYYGQAGYVNVGYNDFWGYLEDTYSVLYLINNTTGWYPGEDNNYDGHSFESPTSDLTKLFNLIDGAIVYFVRYGDIFTSSMDHFSYDSDFGDVNFYGNNTILIDMGFVISNNNMKVYNITFKDYPKTAIIVNGSGCLFDNCSFVNIGGMDSIYGGAMQINANNTIINNTKFINCNATYESYGIADAFGGALFINGSHTKIDNCHFESNTVSNDGSHVYINEGLNNVSLTNNNFTFGNIVGSGHGSGVVVQGTNVYIVNNNFTNNTGQIGSAMSIIGDVTFLTVNSNNFTNNTALQNGALYLNFTNSYGQSIMISGNNFNNNTAYNGGALFVDPIALNNFVMLDNDYTNNTAVYDGGAVYINSPGFELVDVTIENNTAVHGGGVYVNAAGVTIRNVDFIGNNATSGGALYVNALNTNVVDSNFIANTANTSDSMGSAVYVSSSGGITLTNVELDKNFVYGRNSSLQRGDIYVDKGKFADNGIVYGSNPYKQYLSNESVLTLTIAYVSELGGGSGIAYDSPATLTEVLKILGSDSIIYLVGDEDLIFEGYVLSNLDNVTVVNYNDGENRKTTGNNKYLFILPIGKINIKRIFNNHDKILNKIL